MSIPAKPVLVRSRSTMLEFDDNIVLSDDLADSDNESTTATPAMAKDHMKAMSEAIATVSSPSTTTRSATTVSATTASIADADKSVSSEKKRKHVKTNQPKGKFSKMRKNVEYLTAVVRSQQMYGKTEEQIKTSAMSVLAKHSEQDLTQLLGEIGKLNATVTESNHTNAINAIADARGDVKVYYQSLQTMTGVMLEDEIHNNECAIEELVRTNNVLQYYLETQNTNKAARSLLKRFILDSIASRDD